MFFKHDYNSHTIAAPMIKDVEMAIEDTAGELVTTHSLIGTLQGLIERFGEGMPQQEKDSLVSMRLIELTSLAIAIEDRVKESVIMLNAIAEQNLRPTL